jgi:hypothetical protein
MGIWLVSRHNYYFPSVLEKLSPNGEVRGEYWSNGHITQVKFGLIGERRVVLVGATNNEHNGASLAVLDEANFSGSAPGEDSKYQCTNCPPGEPLAFFVFPANELSKLLNERPAVSEIRMEADGKIIVTVLHARATLPGGNSALRPSLSYTFDSNFRLVGAEADDSFRETHARLELLGKLKHPFGPACLRQLLPILRWNGREFVNTLTEEHPQTKVKR